jgi:hypothetical protein
MHDTASITALMIFVAPFAALTLKTHSSRVRARKSERAWELMAKLIV